MAYKDCTTLLPLSNGRWLSVAGADANSCSTITKLQKVMQLQSAGEIPYNLLVTSNGTQELEDAEIRPESAVIQIPNSHNGGDLSVWQLIHLSCGLAHHAELEGGIMVHGALAEWNGHGVVLAGGSKRGKSTASSRLLPPWRSLSDDTTLLMKSPDGIWWARAWPTWSKFLSNGPGGTWDVRHAVPLTAIYFLSQAQDDKVSPLNVGEAVCQLVEVSEQVLRLRSQPLNKEELRVMRLLRFDNICNLAQTVLSYQLHFNKNGTFWIEIERSIAERDKVRSS